MFISRVSFFFFFVIWLWRWFDVYDSYLTSRGIVSRVSTVADVLRANVPDDAADYGSGRVSYTVSLLVFLLEIGLESTDG